MFIALVFAVPVDDVLASMTIRYALFMITLHPLLCRFRFSVHLGLNTRISLDLHYIFWQCLNIIEGKDGKRDPLEDGKWKALGCLLWIPAKVKHLGFGLLNL